MHAVLELMRKRKEENSRPGERTDRFKLGLAIEGGGMRGIVTSGMGVAIEHLGLLNVFDVIYGTSAGAFNGAYLIAGQATYGGTIYYQNINNRMFINMRRLLYSQRPIMSLDYLVYEVTKKQKVLDCKAILASPIPLVMLASCVEELKAARLRDFSSPDDIYRALLATARLPAVAGPPVQIDGRHYFDGGVFEAIPFPSAIEEGCTHTLVFSSRLPGQQIPPPSILEKIITRATLKQYPGIEQALYRRREKHPKDVAFLESKTKKGDGPPYIYLVRPSKDSKEVSRLERGYQKLVDGGVSGFNAVFQLFSKKKFRVRELFERAGSVPI